MLTCPRSPPSTLSPQLWSAFLILLAHLQPCRNPRAHSLLCFWVSTALLLRDFTPSFQVSRTSGLCSQRLCHGDSPRFWEGPPLRCSRLTSLLRLCSSVCWISSATAQVTAPRTAPQLNQRATERAGSLTEPPMLPGDEAGMS